MRPTRFVVLLLSGSVLVLVPARAGSAQVGNITLASTSDTGAKANSGSVEASLSADGTKVAFGSFATNLDPADTDGVEDIYVKDLMSGEVILASTSDNGVKGNGSSFFTSLSADGTDVAFVSASTNLDPADGSSDLDVYVKDLITGELVLASTSDRGRRKGNNSSLAPALSADGTEVAFFSFATNLERADDDAFPDVYVKDLITRNLILASTSDTGEKGDGDSSYPSLSADGTKVAFTSVATNLDPADTDAVDDIYVKDLRTGEVTLASTSDIGIKGNSQSIFAALSADGATVAFQSRATNLDPADKTPKWDVYVKDLVSSDLILASTTSTGAKGRGDSEFPSLSADGSKVAFQALARGLDPADTDAVHDIYVKDLITGSLILGSTSDAGVKGNGASLEPSLWGDGTAVAFHSFATNLDPADTDLFQDVYVKEV